MGRVWPLDELYERHRRTVQERALLADPADLDADDPRPAPSPTPGPTPPGQPQPIPQGEPCTECADVPAPPEDYR